MLDFVITDAGWVFYSLNQKKFPITWKTCSWYNIRKNIIIHPDNTRHIAFTGLNNILPIYPNTNDRSFWRLQDYKNKIAHLKESYRFQNKPHLAKLFKQVFTFFLYIIGY